MRHDTRIETNIFQYSDSLSIEFSVDHNKKFLPHSCINSDAFMLQGNIFSVLLIWQENFFNAYSASSTAVFNSCNVPSIIFIEILSITAGTLKNVSKGLLVSRHKSNTFSSRIRTHIFSRKVFLFPFSHILTLPWSAFNFTTPETRIGLQILTVSSKATILLQCPTRCSSVFLEHVHFSAEQSNIYIQHLSWTVIYELSSRFYYFGLNSWLWSRQNWYS